MLPGSGGFRSGRLSVPALGVDLTRRGTLAGLVGLALSAGVPGASAWAQSSLAGAASFMRRVGDELAAIVGGDGSKAEKRQKLQSLIDRAVLSMKLHDSVLAGSGATRRLASSANICSFFIPFWCGRLWSAWVITSRRSSTSRSEILSGTATIRMCRAS